MQSMSGLETAQELYSYGNEAYIQIPERHERGRYLHVIYEMRQNIHTYIYFGLRCRPGKQRKWHFLGPVVYRTDRPYQNLNIADANV